MRCLELHEWMSLKLDGRLAATEEADLQRHLDSCAACSQAWRRWQQVEALFAGAPMAQPPADLVQRVMARLDRRPQPRAVGGSVLVMGLGLATVAAALAVPVVLWLSGAVVALAGLPGVLTAACDAAMDLWAVALTVAEAARLLLWAVLSSPSLLVAPIYAALALAMAAVWVRVAVVRHRPLPEGRDLRA